MSSDKVISFEAKKQARESERDAQAWAKGFEREVKEEWINVMNSILERAEFMLDELEDDVQHGRVSKEDAKQIRRGVLGALLHSMAVME